MLSILSNAFGPSGCEDEVREIIKKEMESLCDEMYVDNIGNLICHRKGDKVNNKSIMLTAHMDEVGFIISYVTNEGYLKFKTIGGIDPNVLISKKIVIGENRIKGVIGTKPIHQNKSSDDKLKISDLYIDIGAKNKDDALKYVDLGDYACFDSRCVEFGDGFIKGKALDDRVGCYALINIAKRKPKADIYYVFAVQEEVGHRGVIVATLNINPAFAIVLEGTTCSDVPGTDEFGFSTHIGHGAALSIRDGGAFSDVKLTQEIIKIAKENDIKCQYKQTTMGGNDDSAIQITENGIKVAAVSVPCRYIHSQSNVAK
ncbi:MAG: M42 family peptidase, partial [Clostridia bacterium]|nr:M42 family peptidase [Clostridia bacterium]